MITGQTISIRLFPSYMAYNTATFFYYMVHKQMESNEDCEYTETQKLLNILNVLICTCSCPLCWNSKVGWFTTNTMSKAWSVCCHVPTAEGIHMKLEWWTYINKNIQGILKLQQFSYICGTTKCNNIRVAQCAYIHCFFWWAVIIILIITTVKSRDTKNVFGTCILIIWLWYHIVVHRHFYHTNI